jgi:hypothetical protein
MSAVTTDPFGDAATESTGSPFEPAPESPAGDYSAQAIDINSLDAYNDVDEIDPEKSIYDQIPPPPAGKYVLTLSAVKDGANEKKCVAGFNGSVMGFSFQDRDNRTQNHLMIVVDHTIDPDQPGAGQSTREWLSTMVQGARDDVAGTTPIDTYLGKLGSSGVGLSRGQKVTKLYTLLAGGNAKVRATLDWELVSTQDTPVLDKQQKPKLKKDGTPQTERKVFKKGMASFPQGPNKQPIPLNSWTLPDGTVVEARTRWYIKDMQPLGAAGQ